MDRSTEYRDMLIQARRTAKKFIDQNCNPLDRRLLDWEDYAQEGVLRLLRVEQSRSLNGDRKPYLNRIVRNCILGDLRKRSMEFLSYQPIDRSSAFANIEEMDHSLVIGRKAMRANSRKGLVAGIILLFRTFSLEDTTMLICAALGCSKEAARKHIARASISQYSDSTSLCSLSDWDAFRRNGKEYLTTGEMPALSVGDAAQLRLAKCQKHLIYKCRELQDQQNARGLILALRSLALHSYAGWHLGCAFGSAHACLASGLEVTFWLLILRSKSFPSAIEELRGKVQTSDAPSNVVEKCEEYLDCATTQFAQPRSSS